VLEREDVEEMTLKIFNFFRYWGGLDGNIRYVDSTAGAAAFTIDEISHMEDVRKVIKNFFYIFSGSTAVFIILLILLVSMDKNKNLRKIGFLFFWSSLIVLLIIILLFFMGNNFPSLFDNFHRLFFPQGNYIFSEGSLLITMFPFGFFYQFFIRLIISISVIAAFLLITGTILFLAQGKMEKR
jgi:integral membrane protein (TIGR01906 family)